MTTKAAKLAESNEGAEILNLILDAIHGKGRKTVGNGTYKGK